MERPTIKIDLPVSKLSAEVQAYVSGGEIQQIRDTLMANTKVRAGADGKPIPEIEITPETTNKANELAVQYLVLSIGDKSKENGDDMVEVIKDLPSQDYDLLLAKLNEITSPKAQEQ